MNRPCHEFTARGAFWRTMSILLGIVVLLAVAVPALAIEHFASSQAQVNDVPVGKNAQDHPVHIACNPGAGCFPFTVAGEADAILAPLGVTIWRADIAKLATRIVAPPLPPPKIVILV